MSNSRYLPAMHSELVLHFLMMFNNQRTFYGTQFCNVLSKKTTIAQSSNDFAHLTYLIFVKFWYQCILEMSMSTLKKFLVHIFTLYVIIKYYLIASIFLSANSHWHGSKANPLLYTHFCYLRLFLGKRKYFDLFQNSYCLGKIQFKFTDIISHVLKTQRFICKQFLWCRDFVFCILLKMFSYLRITFQTTDI